MCARTWIENGLTTMLSAKRSVGVAPEADRWNPLHAGGEAWL